VLRYEKHRARRKTPNRSGDQRIRNRNPARQFRIGRSNTRGALRMPAPETEREANSQNDV
jgi:hypothetical protein